MMAPLGVCVWDVPRYAHYLVSYPQYVHEILGHAGLCYERIAPGELAGSLPHLRVLVTLGESELPAGLRDALAAWLKDGGAWISIGGVCGMGDAFAVQVQPAAYKLYGHASNLGEGYMEVTGAHPVLDHISLPLHYFGGESVQANGGRVLARSLDAHQRPTERAAIVENAVGKGMCLLVAPDITGTVVRIQQGVAISRDGVSAPDGTAPVNDTILKTDDGLALDWIFDRQPAPGVPGMSVFLQPIADLWREVLLRAILYMAERRQSPVALLWYYPRNLTALAEFSHDTDGNDPSGARRMLEVLAEAEVHSTWCMLDPGYPPEVIGAIRQAGHELAMHYDAFTVDRPWCEANFRGQRQFLTELYGGQAPTSNKNHYLRWQGDSEFWEWCARGGVQIDQSKGPSKTGASFFTFGTCHPYLPLDTAGQIIDVLELPTLTQDMVITAPMAALDPLIGAVARSHGVLHLLFHPGHIAKPGQAEAFVACARRARAAGMEWWTAGEINTWERARRQTRWQAHGESRYSVCAGASGLSQATVLVMSPLAQRVRINGVSQDATTVERWGFAFQSVVCDLQSGVEFEVEVL
jgi:hypothetical protein